MALVSFDETYRIGRDREVVNENKDSADVSYMMYVMLYVFIHEHALGCGCSMSVHNRCIYTRTVNVVRCV